MLTDDIWIVFTKSKPLDGCEIAMDDSDYYFAEVFIKASNIHNALQQTQKVLLGKKLEVQDVSKCLRFISEEWKSDTPENHSINQAINALTSTGQTQISTFRSEEIQEDMQYQHIITELD